MPNHEARYRRNADEAMRHAMSARSDIDQVEWLRVALGWNELVRQQRLSDVLIKELSIQASLWKR